MWRIGEGVSKKGGKRGWVGRGGKQIKG